MLKKNQVTLPRLIMICLLLFGGISFVACKKEAGVFTGYIGETWFEFPADQYTFMASVKQQDDRQVIADVLWGFKYPSMQPLLPNPEARGGFMGDWVGTDWVAIGIRERQEKFKLENKVNVVINAKGTLGLRDNDSYIVEEKPNQFNLYHAYLADTEKYKGAIGTAYGQNVYWYKSNDQVLTFISCKDHGRVPGGHCSHTTVDELANVIVTLSYDEKYLAKWKDIQDKTLTILHSFSKK